MHDIIVHVGHRRLIIGFAKSWMDGSDNAKFLRPRKGEFQSMPNASAVQEYQWLAAPGGKHDSFDAVDGVDLSLESGDGIWADQ